jgi:hypothetical protein
MYWGLLWKSPRPSKRQRRPLIWENAFGEVYLGIYQEKGIPFAKVSENGPAVINPEAARRTAVKQCDEYIKRVSSCQRYDIEAGFIGALFKGVREVWATAAPAQVTDVDLNDMYQAR